MFLTKHELNLGCELKRNFVEILYILSLSEDQVFQLAYDFGSIRFKLQTYEIDFWHEYLTFINFIWRFIRLLDEIPFTYYELSGITSIEIFINHYISDNNVKYFVQTVNKLLPEHRESKINFKIWNIWNWWHQMDLKNYIYKT